MLKMNAKLKYLHHKINQVYLASEPEMIQKLLAIIEGYDSLAVHHKAYSLVQSIRENSSRQTLVEAFLHEYQLNSEEGIVLMSIAEALLRIPDSHTQDLFLQEKLTQADWDRHLLHSDSLLVNFATRALDITGTIENQFKQGTESQQSFTLLASRLGLPLIRNALKQAMQQLAYQFVIAETIEEALAQAVRRPEYLYSFDMLGEAALTSSDTERYLNAYAQAIKALAKHSISSDPHKNPGISIKLSALCARYEPRLHHQAVQQISSKLLYLVIKARRLNICITVDAEESERLDMSLEIFNNVISNPALKGWSGFGLAVQAYQKRAINTLHWLIALAESLQCRIPVRLVKGAYWDSEIKRAQVNGLEGYPVFTHKSATDVSYLACVKLILSNSNALYPQFATHNAHTVAAILDMGKNHPGYEFQHLHGMGEQLYVQLLKQTDRKIPCRIYAPVGTYQELLPYLVRRLLENGANTSFINQVENPEINIDKVIADPVCQLKKTPELVTSCVLPKNLFAQQRINSIGTNLADLEVLIQLQHDLQRLNDQTWFAAPLINGQCYTGTENKVFNPA